MKRMMKGLGFIVTLALLPAFSLASSSVDVRRIGLRGMARESRPRFTADSTSPSLLWREPPLQDACIRALARLLENHPPLPLRLTPSRRHPGEIGARRETLALDLHRVTARGERLLRDVAHDASARVEEVELDRPGPRQRELEPPRPAVDPRIR